MRNIRTFRQFLEHGEPEHLCSSHIYVEDLSGNQKKTKMDELEKLLKAHDYFYVYANGRIYDRGKQSQEQIERLVKDIGPSGLKLYRKYLKKNESKEPTGTGKYMSSLFPEMRSVEPYDNSIPLGESGTSHLHDGNLFSGFQFFPRSPKPLSTEEKHYKRTEIYGKVYNGE